MNLISQLFVPQDDMARIWKPRQVNAAPLCTISQRQPIYVVLWQLKRYVALILSKGGWASSLLQYLFDITVIP